MSEYTCDNWVVIKMKGDLPGNKIAEQGVAEGSEQTNESLDRLLYFIILS